MKTFLPGIFMLLLITTSCNKNQRTVDRIDGKWNVIEADIQGYGEGDPNVIYEFEYGKLKHDEFCDYSVHNFATDDVTSGIYTIDDQGKTISMTISDGFGFEYREYSIERLSFRKMILTNPEAPHGEMSRIVLKRVD